MTIEEIRNLISEAEYDYIGIRADSRDYQIGEDRTKAATDIG